MLLQVVRRKAFQDLVSYVQVTLLQEAFHSSFQLLNGAVFLNFFEVELTRLLAEAMQAFVDQLWVETAELSVVLLPLFQFFSTEVL